MAVDSEQIDVWTDGACTGNPGPGGWGAILVWRGIEKEISGGEADTTNNRMELMAAIQALEALHRTVNVHIRTDSQYVLKGITQWMVNWKRNGWKTKAGQPVKNADLWQRLDAVCARLPVEWTWVKGHAGNVMNEKADELAREAIPKGKTV